ncbi:hypothetical protein [Burkholderia sp. MSMB1498]|uniref:hypothetical protein n=1 Tax=Burkholderia sp. MSMB1498 TaxID=1637842 RepID=UPI000AF55875|nr:hypothetical protein [Burkholderia sp. MSMB1498]
MDRNKCISLIERGCIISVITVSGDNIVGIACAVNQEAEIATIKRDNYRHADIEFSKIVAIFIKHQPSGIERFRVEIDSLSGEKLIERVKNEFLSSWQRAVTPLSFRFRWGRTSQENKIKMDCWRGAVRTLQAALQSEGDGIIRQIAMYMYAIKHDACMWSENYPSETIEEKLKAIPAREYVTLYGDFYDPMIYSIEQGRLLEIDQPNRLIKLRSAFDQRDIELDIDSIYAIDSGSPFSDVAAWQQ